MICFLQARMSSKRLPGKTMIFIKDKPLIGHVIERIKKAKTISRIVVLTSNQNSDLPIIKYCKLKKIECVKGSLQDVASRYLKAIRLIKPLSFVRITADSPTIDPNLIDKLVKRYKKKNFDIVTNCEKRTFPKGQSVEILKSKLLLSHYKNFKKKYYLEHLTSYFYSKKKMFKIYNLKNKNKYTKKNLSIDSKKDLNRYKVFLEKYKKTPLNWKLVYRSY